MYRLIRVYDDGHVVTGKYLFTELQIEQLSSLVTQIKTITYEFAIAYCVEEEECGITTESIPAKKKDAIAQTQ